MKTLDRYILRSFVTTALLFFIVMLLLRIVADLTINIDEFAKLETESVVEKVSQVVYYYAYQSLTYFTELGGVIIMASAAFTLAMMNHTNELTAVLASGVSLHRVTLPIIICAMLMGGLIIVDQEFVIPKVAHKLVLKRGEVAESKKFEVRLVTDGSGAVWYAKKYHAGTQTMILPVILIRNKQLQLLVRVSGTEAHPHTMFGRNGWVLDNARISRTEIQNVWAEMPNSKRIHTKMNPTEILKEAREIYRQATGKTVDLEQIKHWPDAIVSDDEYGLKIYAKDFIPEAFEPRRGDWQRGGRLSQPTFTFTEPDGTVLGQFAAASGYWRATEENRGYWELEDGAFFYPSDMTGENLILRQSSKWMDYMSTSDLVRLIQLKRVPDRRTAELIKHVRFTTPINNLVMLLLGLPFVLSRERNIRASATLCLLTVGTFFAFCYISRSMDLDPVLAAWLPILLFGPLSVLMLDSLKT